MLTRREVLRGSLVAVAGGIFMPGIFERALSIAASDHALAAEGPAAQRTLIIIQLAGGNDGLNTVIPYQDSQYFSLRPTLGVKPENAIPLNDRLAFHPNLTDLKGIWDKGKLAIVESVGYDHPSLSHFQAMDIWQTADPAHGRHSGWLSTMVQGAVDSQGHPLGAVALGSALPPALCCPPIPPSVLSKPDNYRVLPDPRDPQLSIERYDSLQKLYRSYQAPAPYAALLESTSESTAMTSSAIQQIAGSYQTSVVYPSTPLSDGLKLFAALINQKQNLRIGYVLLGGFDTHANQLQEHPKLMQTLSQALGAFVADLEAHGTDQETLILTWSEFGRRVAENSSGGTDHGTAAPLFVVGGSVKGGLYGEPPDLSNLDDGNLKFAVDFRSVYATVLDGWLEADSRAVLGQSFGHIPLL